MFEMLEERTTERVTTVPVVSAWSPDGLDEIVPGMFLAGILSSLSVSELSGHDRVVVLRAQQRMASFYEAQLAETMTAIEDHCAQLFDGDVELAHDAASAEIRCALNLTRRAAEGQLDFAQTLRHRLPVVWDALLAGSIDVRRAKTIAYETAHLPAETAQLIVDQVMIEAPNLTTGRIAARLRRLSIDAAPDEAKDRYEHAVDGRKIVLTATDQGTATIGAYDLPPDRAARAVDLINGIAESLRVAGERRDMDQLRADVFLDLLNGDTPGAGHELKRGKSRRSKAGVVDVRVDLATLTRLAEHSGELAGYGPVIADIARQVAEDNFGQQWRFAVTDETDQIIGSGITRRRPTAALRRHVETRNPTCVFDNCRHPASSSDVDHTKPWSDGGKTAKENLDPLCPHDHYLRHKAGWTYQRNPDGTITWTSRLGHTYTNKPDPP